MISRKGLGEAREAVGSLGQVFLATLLVAACSTSAPPPAPARPSAGAAAVARDALVGNWLFEMKRGGGDSIQHSLHFSMSNGILAGS